MRKKIPKWIGWTGQEAWAEINFLLDFCQKNHLRKCLGKTVSKASVYSGMSSYNARESWNFSKLKQFISLEAQGTFHCLELERNEGARVCFSTKRFPCKLLRYRTSSECAYLAPGTTTLLRAHRSRVRVCLILLYPKAEISCCFLEKQKWDGGGSALSSCFQIKTIMLCFPHVLTHI